MEEVVRQDILSVISQAEIYIREHNTAGLKELSDHTIHNSSIFQDQDSVIMAVVIYSLSKIMEKSDGNFSQHVLAALSYARSNLVLRKEKEYRDFMKKLIDYISKTDSMTKKYIEEVISQAKIKKGGRIYEHGISMARAAEILEISQWQLMAYIGNSEDTDQFISGKTRERISFARSLFKK